MADARGATASAVRDLKRGTDSAEARPARRPRRAGGEFGAEGRPDMDQPMPDAVDQAEASVPGGPRASSSGGAVWPEGPMEENLVDMMLIDSGESRVDRQWGGICAVYSPPCVAPLGEKAGLGPG
eukprot:4472970-Lingulodinium_polyedra.AAC.1